MVGSLVCSFVGSLVQWFNGWFVGSLVRWFVGSAFGGIRKWLSTVSAARTGEAVECRLSL